MTSKSAGKVAGKSQKAAPKSRKRSAATGRFVGVATAPRASQNTVTQQTKSTVRTDGVVEANARLRSTPADDPLAPERTRWLADAVGGGGKLAAMLGVSPSQTSRWAKGDERPSAQVAPLLIDLEHVLARARLVWAEPAASTWMTSANARLDGARPVDVLTLRGVGAVLEVLDASAWGGAA